MATSAHKQVIRRAMMVFVLLAFSKALYSLIRIITSTAPDFVYYYEAASEIRERITNPIHLLPPPSLLAFIPIYVFPYYVSQAIWVIGSFVCLGVSVWILCHLHGIKDTLTRLCIIALTYVSFPSQFTLGMGQVNFIVLLLIVGSVYAETYRREYVAGSMLAFAILYKPEFVLLFPVWILYRRWKTVTAAGFFLSLFLCISLFVYGWDAFGIYLTRLRTITHSWVDIGIYYNQGLSGLVARLGIGYSWVYMLLSFFVLTLTAYMFWKKHVRFPDSIWLSLPVFLLVEPIAWQHHLVFLLPVYIYFWNTRLTIVRRLIVVVSYGLVSWNFASPAFLDTMRVGWLVGSHGTVGIVFIWLLSIGIV